jgi:hypothetical protein
MSSKESSKSPSNGAPPGKYYDKSSSFFDCISSEAMEKADGLVV